MIINNSVSADDYTTRAERIQLLSDNIDTFAVELAIVPPRLNDAQNADAEWEEACAKCVVEAGQKDEAYETFHQAVEAAANYYSAAKKHLLTIIYESGGKPDDFINAYGFNVRSPRRYKKLTAAIEAWKRNHDFLVVEGDPRVVADAIINQLVGHKDNIDGLSNTAFIEKDESDTAFSEKRELFDRHTNLLQFIYTAAVLVWGNDDSRLNLLGFKPKSEIWTPGEPEPGVPVHPEAASFEANYLGQKIVELVYGPVFGAVAGVIRKRKDDGVSDWEILIEGLPMNDEDRAPFRDTKCKAGEWEYEFVSYDDEDNPSDPSYATVTVPE
ncbi:MAG: tetratricopeptide repeat protein [bacterium]